MKKLTNWLKHLMNSLFFTVLWKKIDIFCTVKCWVEFLFKYFDKKFNRRDFLKIIHLYRRVADVEKFMEKLLWFDEFIIWTIIQTILNKLTIYRQVKFKFPFYFFVFDYSTISWSTSVNFRVSRRSLNCSRDGRSQKIQGCQL